jgi:Uma2 family endonuclease
MNRTTVGAILERMVTSAPRRATYDDLLSVPDNLVGELIDGELITQPRPATRHARAASRLGAELDGPFDRGKGGPGGWIILDEPELHLHGDALVPDLGGWRRERMPLMPEVAAVELAPDWVCEVLSPSTQSHDRIRKMRVYAREQVAHVWLIDPLAQTLEVYTLSAETWVRSQVAHAAEKIRALPFDAIELDLAVLWER